MLDKEDSWRIIVLNVNKDMENRTKLRYDKNWQKELYLIFNKKRARSRGKWRTTRRQFLGAPLSAQSSRQKCLRLRIAT